MKRYSIDDFLRAASTLLTVADIAEHVGCSMTTARQYLHRAELAGYVTLTDNGRLLVVELTTAGHERLAATQLRIAAATATPG